MATKRPVRVANCSGAAGDPGDHMYNQATSGPVDVITGDYLAEVNLANNAVAMAAGKHPGWQPTAWDGLQKTMKTADEKRIKIVINGGALNPKGLAEKAAEYIKENGLNLKVAYVTGDDMMHKMDEILAKSSTEEVLGHLDSANASVKLVHDTKSFLKDRENMPLVSSNAYLGIRAIKRGLEEGADIIICGRVSDASPVMAAAAWWHGWSDEAYDELAGSLIAGHLIECSTYVTGGNFAGFYKYDITGLMNLGLPIVEIAFDGSCVVTKHESLNGIVTADTVKCQLLYELQGNIYLNSDVKADITHVKVEDVGKNRVEVTGVKGAPPPSTTKLAGYATNKKYDYQEMQLRKKLEEWDVIKDFDVLDFQRIGVPQENPKNQLASTTGTRIFAQSKSEASLRQFAQAWIYNGMAHFAGMHCTLDMRQMTPIPFLGYFPAIIEQSELEESINFLGDNAQRYVVGPSKKTEKLQPRENYDPTNPVDLASFGETTMAPIGDIALARSGDKSANINFGIFVHTAEEWDWLRSFMTKAQMKSLMGTDWKESYYLERVEMPELKAVHFVIYGPLGRGVSSSKLLDSLGKGFGEFIRAVHVPIPTKFLSGTTNGVN